MRRALTAIPMLFALPLGALAGQEINLVPGTPVRVVLENPSLLPISIVRELNGTVAAIASDTLLLAIEGRREPVRVPLGWISRVERWSGSERTRKDGSGSAVSAVFGGALLGSVGLLGGGYVGASLEARSCGGGSGFDFCGLGGFIIGGVVGEVLGIALGSHLGNGRRGSFGQDVLTSLTTAAAGIGLVAAIDAENAAPLLITVAAMQLGATILVEVSSGRRRSREVLWSVKPLRGGRLGIGASVRFW